MNDQPRKPTPMKVTATVFGKLLCLLLALFPIVPLLHVGNNIAYNEAGDSWDKLIVFVVTPLFSLLGSYGLVAWRGVSRWVSAILAVLLGTFFFFFNCGVGIFCGCLFSGKSFP